MDSPDDETSVKQWNQIMKTRYERFIAESGISPNFGADFVSESSSDSDSSSEVSSLERSSEQFSHENESLLSLTKAQQTKATSETNNETSMNSHSEQSDFDEQQASSMVAKEQSGPDTLLHRRLSRQNSKRLTLDKLTTSSEPFECVICTQKYNTVSKLQGHYTVKHPKRKFPRHYKDLQKFLLTCQLCERKCKSHHDKQKHLKIHSDENRKFRCFICTMRYFSASILKMHISKYHPKAALANEFITKGKIPPACSLCYRRFKNETELQDHLNAHAERTAAVKASSDEC